jgi:hypothetical protein
VNKEKTHINLNVNKDDSNLNDFLFCWDKFKSRPNKIVIHNTYSTKQFLSIVENIEKSKNVFTEVIPDYDDYIINDKILVQISDNSYISYIVIDKNLDSSIVSDVVFYYKEPEDFTEISKLIEELENTIVNFTDEESYNLNTLNFSNGALEIEPIEYMVTDDENVEVYYSHKSFKSISKLVKKIKKSDKGLSILWGDRGTGKTSIINHIADKLDRIIIFIPNNLLEVTISNPDFRKFIKKYQKPIIVIDDCEMIFSEYFTKSNVIVNNLLQLVDGYLSDSLKINIITIFNVESESEIDHTLLDCNNLIDVVEFDYLSQDESNELSKILGNKTNHKTKNRLVDIIQKRNNGKEKRLGF